MSEASWYVIHTYSGYEDKVKSDIEKTIKNRKLKDQISKVIIPTEEGIEIKKGVEKKVTRKVFPCYILIRMIMNDVTWYVVRNTRGVTGFVGPDSKPVPLTEEELVNLGKSLGFAIPGSESEDDLEADGTMDGNSVAGEEVVADIKSINENKQNITIDFEVGDMISVNSGGWEGTVADIKSINKNRQSVTIEVEMFGRPTPVELKFTEVRKM